MALELTPEQEQRIQAVVSAGAYSSAKEAVEAAVTAVEIVSAAGFEGSGTELETLLVDGLNSKELSESEFWDSVDQSADSLLASHKSNRGS